MNFSLVDLTSVDFSNANLTGAYFRGVTLRGASFANSNLTLANLAEANLAGCDFTGTLLKSANLTVANLSLARFNNTNFENAEIGATTFVANDLSVAKGLTTIHHRTRSYLSIDTLYQSRGDIPELFLRGCGLSDWQIEEAKLYNPDLSNEEINNIQYRIHDLRVRQSIQISPLFISYSHMDSSFVDAVEKLLIKQGIRFWRDIHHAKAGRLEKQIDRAISLNDIILLVLSKHSTDSDWVEHEARKAREKEKQTGKDALCPVALDDTWKTCRWPERLREQIMKYNILDFSNWQDNATFQKMFGKLLEGLNLFYK